MPVWLSRTDVPLFISRRRLSQYYREPMAIGKWALDSGGFTELSMYGRWTVTAKEYVREVKRWQDRPGNLQWAAIMDWMCEPFIVEKTGLTVREHQIRTIESYLELTSLAPEITWLPVLQGYEYEEYIEHVEDYYNVGVNLDSLPLVGLGSVCRRQHTGMVEKLIRALETEYDIRIHGFGFKLQGLRRVADVITSADSMAWSLGARRLPPLPGHTHKHCNSCIDYALIWRQRVMQIIGGADS